MLYTCEIVRASGRTFALSGDGQAGRSKLDFGKFYCKVKTYLSSGKFTYLFNQWSNIRYLILVITNILRISWVCLLDLFCFLCPEFLIPPLEFIYHNCVITRFYNILKTIQNGEILRGLKIAEKIVSNRKNYSNLSFQNKSNS